jgi:hypothetical protein
MDGDALSIGTTGSLIANLLLLAIMENVSEPPWWTGDHVPYETTTYASAPTGPKLIETWRPFIDDPGAGAYRKKTCPQPRSKSAAQRLALAPLPPGYDPHAPREEPLHACILVQADGTIVAVRLLGSTGRRGLDARLRATIVSSWTVTGASGAGSVAWHRVRLNSGPDEGEVYDPGLTY